MNTPSVDKRVIVPGAALVALITLIIYLPSLGNGFVNWDDPGYIAKNEHIRSLGLAFFKWVFTNIYFSNWHPLTMVSYAVDYALWGENPFWYHLENIVLHSVNTSLVFFLTAALMEKTGSGAKKTIAASLVTSLLFGIHPLHVESVSWISEKKDVLSGFFFFLSLLAYLKYTGGAKSARWYGASLLLFLFSLLSKPMVVTFPVVLLILDFYPLGRLSGVKDLGRLVPEKVPFFALSALSAVVTIFAQRGKAMATLDAVPFAERVITATRGVVFYIYKMAMPLGLSPLYSRAKGLTFTDPWFVVCLLLIISISVFCLVMAGRRREFLASWLYYLVTISPVLGLIQVGRQAAADRYTYLPALSLFMLAGAGAGLLYKKLDKGGVKVALRAALVAVLAVLCFITVRQQGFWKDGFSLWTRQTAVYPESYLGWYNRAQLYKENGMYREAIADLDRALEASPYNAETYSLRGNSYKRLGNLPMALADMQMAIAIKPDNENFHYNLSLIYGDLGMKSLAIESAEEAARLGSSVAADYANHLKSREP